MAQPDLYKVLGVDKKTSAADIKKAYRKLARENHPDQNPGDEAAEERFKQVSAAYDILGDPEKRKQYDSGGMFSGGSGGGPGGVPFDPSNFGDIFSSFFGGEQLVDFGNELVGKLLDFVLRAAFIILGNLFLLEQILEVVDGVGDEADAASGG